MEAICKVKMLSCVELGKYGTKTVYFLCSNCLHEMIHLYTILRFVEILESLAYQWFYMIACD